MNRKKIVSHDLTRQKIREALKARNAMQPAKQQTAQELHNIRKDSVSKIGNKNKVVHKIERPYKAKTRRPTTQYLTNVNHTVRKIITPQKGSFNASIVDVGDKYLMVYRPDEIEIRACFLNYDYTIIENSFYKFNLLYVADPRLIVTPDNKVFMTYSNYAGNNHDEKIEGNIIMNLNESKNTIFQGTKISVSPKSLSGRQKNWMPFVHENDLYFISQVCPHQIYKVDWTGEKDSELVFETNYTNYWFIREQLRGNTNAVLMEDGNYLCTFHTAMLNGICYYYDNGCYIFEGKPPFKPLYTASRTYLRAEAAIESHYRKLGAIVCVFPMGMILKDNKIIISYGDNDSCVKIMETTTDEMMKTMLEVRY